MPVFKVVSANRRRRVVVKGSSLEEIVEGAVDKLGLSNDQGYQLILEKDGTEIDDYEIMIDLLNESKEKQEELILKILAEGGLWLAQNFVAENKIVAMDDLNGGANNDHREVSLEEGSLLEDKFPNDEVAIVGPIVGPHLWNKFPKRLLDSCKRGERVSPTDKIAMVSIIANYMLQELETGTRSVAQTIASAIVDTYPNSFCDMIEGQIVGKGMESLRAQIYNAVNYRKDDSLKKKRKSSKSLVNDSDEENDINISNLSRRQDEYGCVEYASSMPENETAESLESKRLWLLEHNIAAEQNISKVNEYMNDTFYSQRNEINHGQREIKKLISRWPYLKEANCLMKHATRLLGKDVVNTWQDSLSKIAAPMRKYFKTKSIQIQAIKANQNSSETSQVPLSKNEKIAARSLQLLQEAKEASKTQGSEVPKSIVIFLLLNVYMQEDENLLIKVIEDSATDEDVKKQAEAYPNLVIRGTSLYDPNALYSVVLENKVIIKVEDILQGISVAFLCYYIFGYAYPLPISKSLEFIQRVLFHINPP